MSAISRLVLNLSIGAKLGIASGLGILLVVAMMITQSQGNIEIRDADARKSAQQTIATRAAAPGSARGKGRSTTVPPYPDDIGNAGADAGPPLLTLCAPTVRAAGSPQCQ